MGVEKRGDWVFTGRAEERGDAERIVTEPESSTLLSESDSVDLFISDLL